MNNITGAIQKILAVLDDEISPQRMDKNEAYTVLSDVLDEIQTRMDALEDEQDLKEKP